MVSETHKPVSIPKKANDQLFVTTAEDGRWCERDAHNNTIVHLTEAEAIALTRKGTHIMQCNNATHFTLELMNLFRSFTPKGMESVTFEGRAKQNYQRSKKQLYNKQNIQHNKNTQKKHHAPKDPTSTKQMTYTLEDLGLSDLFDPDSEVTTISASQTAQNTEEQGDLELAPPPFGGTARELNTFATSTIQDMRATTKSLLQHLAKKQSDHIPKEFGPYFCTIADNLIELSDGVGAGQPNIDAIDALKIIQTVLSDKGFIAKINISVHNMEAYGKTSFGADKTLKLIEESAKLSELSTLTTCTVDTSHFSIYSSEKSPAVPSYLQNR